MKSLRHLLLFTVVLMCVSHAAAQRTAEVTMEFNEALFDTLLEAVFQHNGPLEFPIAANEKPKDDRDGAFLNASLKRHPQSTECRETLQIVKESGGVSSAVRLRDGKIFAPLAFAGGYNPPLVGCVPFAGYAETNLDLEFDQQSQRLVARARVANVVMNGTGGIGGSVLARLVQSSIDRKINPINIVSLDRLSFPLPLQNNVNLRMKATAIRHEVGNGVLKIYVTYTFVKI